jgi:signal-transduction protein with cAMP-binding, CBS, and nucleotidyltransferase domain
MVTLRDVPLRSVPVAEPQTALDEVLRLLKSDPLQTVVLVGDEAYMGVFDAAALRSELIPARVDPATLEVGPYASPHAVGHPGMTVEQALALMRRRDQDVLPVVENNIYRGVVTRADLEPLAASA